MKTTLTIECKSKKEAAYVKRAADKAQFTFQCLSGKYWGIDQIEKIRGQRKHELPKFNYIKQKLKALLPKTMETL